MRDANPGPVWHGHPVCWACCRPYDPLARWREEALELLEEVPLQATTLMYLVDEGRVALREFWRMRDEMILDRLKRLISSRTEAAR